MSVIIYSTSNCKYCVKAKEFFAEHGVKYTEHDIGKDPEKKSEMLEKSGVLAVPIIDIDGDILVGFDEKTLRELLKMGSNDVVDPSEDKQCDSCQ